MTRSGGAGTLNSFWMTMPMVHSLPFVSVAARVAGCWGGYTPNQGGQQRTRGAEATRTPGLLHAMQALYQLSYSPAALTIAPGSGLLQGSSQRRGLLRPTVSRRRCRPPLVVYRHRGP